MTQIEYLSSVVTPVRVAVVCLVAAALLLAACAAAGSENDAGPSPAAKRPAADPADDNSPDDGRAAAERIGCLGCHSTDGTVGVGPSWKGIWGDESELVDGTTAEVDADYVRRSARDPQAQRVAGFDHEMPKLELTDEELDDIIAFIRSLDATDDPGELTD